jgi:glutaminyl-peptide cyclotransferase
MTADEPTSETFGLKTGRSHLCRGFAVLWLSAVLTSCSTAPPATLVTDGAPVTPAVVLRETPHDSTLFTEGLCFLDDKHLVESTGRRSRLLVRSAIDSQVNAEVKIPKRRFCEGVTVLGKRAYQLTWKDGECFVYDVAEWKHVATLKYSGQGWGITHDGTHLITSDGSAQLTVRSPTDFKPVRYISVRDGKRSVNDLNELEFIEGEVWANVWRTHRIARISEAGEVIGYIDLASIAPQLRDREAVANGIAYNPSTGTAFVTGKYWSKMFEIALPPRLKPIRQAP